MRIRHSSATVTCDSAAAMARAEALAAAGRHAAAERELRDLAAALARRRAIRGAATALVRLGRLLSERGRADAAARTFESALAIAAGSQDAAAAVEARVWLAAAKTDLRRLAEAEALCREARRASGADEDNLAWASAMLARVSLWQGRRDEARTLVDALPPRPLVDERAVFVEGTVVRVLLACGSVFTAGRRLRHGLAEPAADWSAIARVMAATARLRFACAVGDLSAARHEYAVVCELARAARAPLRELRAGVILSDALHRAGQAVEAARPMRRLRRLAASAPPLLRDGLVASRPAHEGIAIVAGTPSVAHLEHLVETCRGATGETVVPAALRQIRDAVGAVRVDLAVPRPGPCERTAGRGVPAAASRVFETGAAVGPVPIETGHEMAVPIRWDDQVIAALVTRWATPPGGAAAWLTAAACIIAGAVHHQLRWRQDEAACARIAPGLLGRGAAMAAVRAAVARAGPAPFSVLIHGESGVGKELVARAIHALSTRHAQRMCDVNCAALPDDLLESELFGYVRGAFTGALADRAGLFEDAHGGTLFLDEVVDLSARAQAKLLRVLQQQEVRRLGESRSRRIDVRIVSAANRDPREAAAAGAFRPDLVYRLDVIRITVPPLRDRREDVADLACHFWNAAAGRVGSRARLGRDAIEALAGYDWPGNVRELQNVLAAMAVSAPVEGRVGAAQLPPHLTAGRHTAAAPLRLDDLRRECERAAVLAALSRTRGQRGRAAQVLGLSRQGLLKLMRRLDVRG